MKRDNFPQSIILTLRDRAGNFCSKPDCKISTRSAHSSSTKTKSTGIAAHICAAAKKGPRFNSNMSMAERKSINNAIWLCCNCATEIDKDPSAFPVSLLLKWKCDAEIRISENHGKPFLTTKEYEVKFRDDLLKQKEILSALLANGLNPTEDLTLKLKGIEEKLLDVEASYKSEVELRQSIETTLNSLKSELPEELLSEAKESLDQGSMQKAKGIFHTIIETGESNLVQAYCASGDIAESEFEYRQAYTYFYKAAVLSDFVPQIVNHAAQLSYKLGNFKDSLQLLENAIAAPSKDNLETPHFLNQQGLIYRAIGDYPTAVKKLNLALEAASKTTEKEIKNNLLETINSNLGLVYLDQGDYSKAKKIYETLIETDSIKYGENSINVSISMSTLGTIFEKEHNKIEAEKLYKKSYSIHRSLYGEDHPETLSPLNNLAMIYIHSNPTLAEKMLRKALRLRIKYFGENHYKTPTILINLAACLSAQNNHTKAIKLYRRALNVVRSCYGDRHPEELRIKHNLSLAMYSDGQFIPSIELMHEVISAREAILGSDHPLTILSRKCLKDLERQNSHLNILEYFLTTYATKLHPTPTNR